MSFIGSSSNRAQLAYKLEGVYPTNFGVPQGGNGTLLNFVSDTLDFQVKTTESKAIRPDRQVNELVVVDATAQGGINLEQVYRDGDPFIQGAVGSDFVVYGTNGVSAAIATLTLTSTTITAGAAPAGVDAFTTLKKGQWFVVIPPAGATAAVKAYFASRPFRVSMATAPTTTVITLDAATPIDTAQAGTTVSGGTLASSYAWNGSTMKSYTLEVGYTDISQFKQYRGMVTSKWDVQLASGAIVTHGFEFMGKDMILGQATLMGTPVAPQAFTPANATKGVVDVYEGGVALSASTYIKTGSFTIDNTLRGQEAVSVFGMAGIGQGTQRVTGKFDSYFVDQTLYNKFLSNTSSSLSIPVLDAAGNGYVYFFPRIKYTAAKTSVGGQDQDNMLSCDFSALPETDATSPYYGKSFVVFRVGA
jgi:hypothetical protein